MNLAPHPPEPANDWRRPAALLGVLTLVITLGGAVISLHQQQAREREQRLSTLERREAADAQGAADLRDALLSRLEALKSSVDRLHDDLHRENDAVIRRVEALERR